MGTETGKTRCRLYVVEGFKLGDHYLTMKYNVGDWGHDYCRFYAFQSFGTGIAADLYCMPRTRSCSHVPEVIW